MPTLKGLPVHCSTCIIRHHLEWDQSDRLSHVKWQIFRGGVTNLDKEGEKSRQWNEKQMESQTASISKVTSTVYGTSRQISSVIKIKDHWGAVYTVQVFASNQTLSLLFSLHDSAVLAPLKPQTFETGFQSAVFWNCNHHSGSVNWQTAKPMMVVTNANASASQCIPLPNSD